MISAADSQQAAGARTTALLTSPAFLLALALLLLNDWVLKAAVGSWWTGKLSDFAGLFAFAVFWSALFPSRARTVVTITAAAFVLWKSPASTPALDAWNAVVPWPLAREVDYSDWIALLALAPAYRVATAPRVPPALAWRRTGAMAIAMLSVFAFAATSVRRPTPIENSPVYTAPGSLAAVRAALDSLGFEPSFRRRDASHRVDTVSLYVRHPPERWIHVVAELRELSPDSTALRVVALIGTTNGPAPPTDTLFRAFDRQVVGPVREWLTSRPGAGRAPLPRTPPSSRD